MKKQQLIIDEIRLRLQAPLIALKRTAAGRYLPGIFAYTALDELTRACKLLQQLEKDRKRACLHKK